MAASRPCAPTKLFSIPSLFVSQEAWQLAQWRFFGAANPWNPDALSSACNLQTDQTCIEGSLQSQAGRKSRCVHPSQFLAQEHAIFVGFWTILTQDDAFFWYLPHLRRRSPSPFYESLSLGSTKATSWSRGEGGGQGSPSLKQEDVFIHRQIGQARQHWQVYAFSWSQPKGLYVTAAYSFTHLL